MDIFQLLSRARAVVAIYDSWATGPKGDVSASEQPLMDLTGADYHLGIGPLAQQAWIRL
jgi:hypothetical protein